MKKEIVITGASSGIGKVTATELAKSDCRLIIIGRNEEKTKKVISRIIDETGNPDIEFIQADLFEKKSIERAIEKIRNRVDHLDLLINNAGGVTIRRITNSQGIECNLMVNHMAPLLFTLGLEELLRKSVSARVVNVSSVAHVMGRIRLDDLNGARSFNGIRAYCNAKLAEVMQSYTMAERFAGTAVSVNALHPGMVNTNFARDNGPLYNFVMNISYPILISPEKGALNTLYVATSEEMQNVTGKYFVRKKSIWSNPRSYDKSLRDRLWQKSLEMLGL